MSTSQMFNTEVCYGSELAYDAELATPFQALLIIPASPEPPLQITYIFCYSAEPYCEAGSARYEHRKPTMQQRPRPLRHGWRWCLF